MGLKIDEQYNPVFKKETEHKPIDDINEVSDETVNKSKVRKKKESNGEKENKTPFFGPITKGLIGFALILFSFLLFIACVSYIKSGPIDQSLVTTKTILENAQNSNIANSGGSFGAAFSEKFFNRGFGIGTFFIITFIFIFGMKLIGWYKKNLLSAFFICAVATITTSSVIGLIFINFPMPYALGGSHGTQLSILLTNLTGVYGALFINIFLIAILAVLCLNHIKGIFAHLKKYLTKRREEKERIKREQEEEKAQEEQKKAEELEEQKAQETLKEVNFDDSDNTVIKTLDIEDDNDDLEDEKETEIDKVKYIAEKTIKQDNSTFTYDETGKEMPIEESSEPVINVSAAAPIKQADKVNEKLYDPTAELSRFKTPPTTILKEVKNNTISVDMEEQDENKERITNALSTYGIKIRSIEVCVGPTVTLYEIVPAEGVRIAKIKGLEDDIAMSIAAFGIRIIAPIPGKGTIGIEVPNREKQTVSIRSIIESEKFQNCKYELPVAMGCTISNDIFIADLTKMPHLLVAGATGMGKSVGLNTILASLLYKKHPSQLKLVMVDPKMVEFGMYEPLVKHYLAQMEDSNEAIITNMHKAVATLNSLVQEMEDRLVLLNDAKERNIQDYNKKFIERKLNPEKGHKFLPYIVVIIDELADLIMNIGRKEVETPIARITQKARAVGIHMILATQRPSTDIITGLIKNNCPSRIAFRVTQMVDSRTILDRSGAQQLMPRGDMLIMYDNVITRVQCAFISTKEVEDIVSFISKQPGYDEPYILPQYIEQNNDSAGTVSGGNASFERDPLFEDAAEFIINGQTASTSSLQRRYSIGYNRAGKIMDQMEAAGIVGPAMGGKPRQVLIDYTQLSRILNNE